MNTIPTAAICRRCTRQKYSVIRRIACLVLNRVGGPCGCRSPPAFLILWAPAGFRLTCYYYRGAYYKAFWADPPNCAVGEPRNSFRGENSFSPYLAERTSLFSVPRSRICAVSLIRRMERAVVRRFCWKRIVRHWHRDAGSRAQCISSCKLRIQLPFASPFSWWPPGLYGRQTGNNSWRMTASVVSMRGTCYSLG